VTTVARPDRPVRTRTVLVEQDPQGVIGSTVRRTVLDNGITVITESLPAARSVSLGVWLGVGSRDESEPLAGVTHFLEHLLFKGTATRTAEEISSEIDSVGGELNAFTGKEYTCYHARVLDRDLPLAVELLSDMVTSSTLPADEIETERDVILEEIAMNEDDPDDTAHDAFVAALYGDAPVGRPIIGTVESVSALTRSRIMGYFRRRYRPERFVVSAAGRVEHAEMVRLVRAGFGVATGAAAKLPAGVRAAGRPPRLPDVSTRLVTRPTEQACFVLGVPGVPHRDERRYASSVLSTILGGGPSSRLFQEIRERRGLAYSVYAMTSSFAETGYFAAGGGCLPEKLRYVLDVVHEQLDDLARDGVTETELVRARGQLRGSFVLGLEDTFSRMVRLARSELVEGELLPVDDVLARIDNVALEDVGELASSLLKRPRTLAVVGPFDSPEQFTKKR
jgi:predicted Zn-dependent peptidase